MPGHKLIFPSAETIEFISQEKSRYIPIESDRLDSKASIAEYQATRQWFQRYSYLFYFQLYLGYIQGKIPIFDSYIQKGWPNHQPQHSSLYVLYSCLWRLGEIPIQDIIQEAVFLLDGNGFRVHYSVPHTYFSLIISTIHFRGCPSESKPPGDPKAPVIGII